MTEMISISDFKNREDRTLLVGVDFDDAYWLHVYILDEELHILTYSNIDDEVKVISDFVTDSTYADDFVTWSNFATTIDVELKALLDDRGVRFTIEWENDHALEADEDGFFGPVPDLD
jgi:hypothetical protein